MDRRIGAIAAVLLVAGTVAALAGGYLVYQQEQSVSRLDEAEGTVRSVGVERVGDSYYPNVTYEYAAGGTTYVARDLYPPAGERRGADEDWAREVAGKYRAGDTVTVYYPPDSPGQATLRQDRTPGPYMALWLGGVAVAFGVLLGAAAIQRGDDDRADLGTDEVRLD